MSVPTEEPLQIRAGTTWEWERSFTDYPAPTWTLTYYLKNASAYISFAAAASGAAHLVTRTATQTQSYTAGKYDWEAQVSYSGSVYSVDRGRIEILPRFDSAAAVDARSNARKNLEAIDTLLLAYSAGNNLVLEYTIGDRTMRYRDAADLMKWRNYWAAEVEREEAANRLAAGLDSGYRILTRLR
jgi:hypothetical protein